MSVSDEKIAELIQAIENLGGSINRLSDEVFMIRGSLSGVLKPQSTGTLDHIRERHDKESRKK